MYDVIVVGARVAGSMVSTLIGERGHRVLLLDRAHFPSDTLSTHFFRAPAFRAFQRIGVFDEVKSTAPQLTVDYNVVDGIVFPEPIEKPEDFPYYLCIRRITLDNILLRRAEREPSVEFIEGARVDGLSRDNGGRMKVTWSGRDGRQGATANLVVGADGFRSFVAKQVHPRVELEEPVNRAMYYAYYRGIQAQEGPAAEFHFRGNHLAYVFPCDDGLTLVAVSVPIEEFKEFKGNHESRFEAEVAFMVEIAPRMGKAQREGPVRGTGSIPGYMRVPYGDNWALVGDAGMVMDPWSGQGIDQASTHAVMLADRVHAYLSGAETWGEAMRAYHQARNEFSLKIYQRTCAFSRDIRVMTQKALQRRALIK